MAVRFPKAKSGTERKTGFQTNGQIDTVKEVQRETETEGGRETETEKQRERATERQRERVAEGGRDSQTEKNVSLAACSFT